FSWDDKPETKNRGLPMAEITEHGDFKWWRQACNFYDWTEEHCRFVVNMVLTHEYGHYWQQLAELLRAMNAFHIFLVNGHGQIELPSSIDDLQAKLGDGVNLKPVRDEFMRTWADIRRYQCREVEVYAQQLFKKEFPADSIERRTGYLAYYTAGC